ncbi:hypothetical protein RLOatenuis_7020 [Rickettsiales bacterium]|nr:hypothetical protein RLOatenuis_7020 [Rickettsiales bacterium]
MPLAIQLLKSAEKLKYLIHNLRKTDKIKCLISGFLRSAQSLPSNIRADLFHSSKMTTDDPFMQWIYGEKFCDGRASIDAAVPGDDPKKKSHSEQKYKVTPEGVEEVLNDFRRFVSKGMAYDESESIKDFDAKRIAMINNLLSLRHLLLHSTVEEEFCDTKGDKKVLKNIICLFRESNLESVCGKNLSLLTTLGQLSLLDRYRGYSAARAPLILSVEAVKVQQDRDDEKKIREDILKRPPLHHFLGHMTQEERRDWGLLLKAMCQSRSFDDGDNSQTPSLKVEDACCDDGCLSGHNPEYPSCPGCFR